MADTSIKISLELADSAAQKALSDFITKGSSAEKSIGKLGDAGTSTFNEISVGIGKSIGAYEIFEGNIAANLVTKAFEEILDVAHELFQTFIVDGVHAAAEAQAALNSLNVALAQSGNYSKQTSEEFEAFTEQLQRTSTFEQSAILKNAALIESLAQLDKNGLQRATQAAVDLASALGITLEKASETVAKAANGNITAFQKMGVQIQKGRTDFETFGNALDAIEEKFGGAGLAKINTYSGAIAQTSNSFENLIESIGNVIVKNPAVIDSIAAVGKIFQELTDSIGSQNNALAILVGQGLSAFLTVGAATVTVADAMVKTFDLLLGVIDTLVEPFALMLVPIRALSVGLDQATKDFANFSKTAADELSAFSNTDSTLGKVATDILRVRDAADVGLAALANGATGTVEPINNSAGAIEHLDESTKAAQERLKAFTEDLLKQADASKTSAAQELAIAKSKADADIETAKAALDQKSINQVEFLTQQAKIQADFQAAQTKIEADQFDQDNARLTAAFDQKVSSEQDYYKARGQLAVNFASTDSKQNQERVKDETKMASQLLTAERNLQYQKVQMVADTFTALSSLMQTSSRELFEIGKAAAIASTIINTEQAIMKTLADGGWFATPLAIAIGIEGAVHVANIAATSPSFEQGGIVPGTSFSGDNVVANVNSGEMILNRGQQSQLFALANGGSSSAINYDKITASFIKALTVVPQAVTVNVGGKTIAEVLRAELASGRTF